MVLLCAHKSELSSFWFSLKYGSNCFSKSRFNRKFSKLIGENGWWNELIGIDKTIDTSKYTILAFNVPGNGFDKEK